MLKIIHRHAQIPAMTISLRIIAFTLASLTTAMVQAQSYPSRPVRILSSGGAGGPNDTQTRGLAQYLGERLGQNFTVENRTGAGGVIAGEACVKAAPDGYTLCTFGVNAVSWNPVLTKMPYDPIRDLVGVAHTGFIDSILSVHPSVAANSLTELIAAAKAKPGAISWASFGLNSTGYFYIEWLRRFRDAQFLHVPYKTAIQSQQAVVAGETMVNIYAAGLTLPMIKAGKVKAISINSEKRSPDVPDVPTELEAGINLPLGSFFNLMAPVATPREILVRLNTEILRIMQDPKFSDLYVKRLGFRNANMNVDEYNDFLRRHRAGFEAFARELGLEKN